MVIMKKITQYFSCVVILLFASSCGEFDNSKITVIDGAVLGQPRNAFYNSLDSIGVKSEVFCTKFMFFDLQDVNKSRLKFYYSEQFDLNRFQSRLGHHLGLYYPLLNESNNVTALYILLVNTCQPVIFNGSSMQAITNMDFTRGVTQNVNIELLDEIESLLTSKYGKPTSSTHGNNNSLCVIEGAEVTMYGSGEDKYSDKLTWETDAIHITLFKGLDISPSCYNTVDKQYTVTPTGEKAEVTGESNIQCMSYPYILYQIKTDVLKKLKLDERKI